MKQATPASPRPKWFIGVFGGGSLVSGKDGDTAKSGYNLGAKIGVKIPEKSAQLRIAAGYLYNDIKTQDDNNALGVYEVKTDMLTLEAAVLSSFGKVELGPVLMMVAGKDISLKEQQKDQGVGLYGGVEGLYKLSPKWDLELNLQQRLDDLSRANVLGNLGVRFSF